MEEKRRRIEFPSPLPEAMIQHIQSFMSGKDAARTTILSKSWYHAWLTRPDLHLVERDFKNSHHPIFFELFAAKTIKRYQRSKLKIHTFTFQVSSYLSMSKFTERMILAAMEIGATHLDLNLSTCIETPPLEVLRSETLIKLSLSGCRIIIPINCPMLKSLTLDHVFLGKDDDVISGALVSLEELRLLRSYDCKLTVTNPYELRSLKRLYLEDFKVDNSFFDNSFPCLKDLSLIRCSLGYKRINISSASLERITIVADFDVFRAKFVVPNIASFSFSGFKMPFITVKEASCLRQWESCITIRDPSVLSPQWYRRLHRLLRTLRSSTINLTLKLLLWVRDDEEVLPSFKSKSVAVENVTIEAPHDLGLKLKFPDGLFRVCSPRFVTHCWLPRGSVDWMRNNNLLHNLYHQLMLQIANAEDINSVRRAGLGIKEVNVEVYEKILTEWRPLVLEKPLDALVAPPNERKVRFELKWW